jgi:hypothetical protein
MGKPLKRINVVFHGPEENSVCPGNIPMEDIAHINVGHFRNSADYENALHMCGSPTPIACGFGVDEAGAASLTLGTHRAWVAEKADAKAYFLSYNGNDASALTLAMDTKEKQMAAQGARMLEQQGSGKGQEAFETVQIRQAGDMSALMTATIASSQSLTEVLKWVTWWQTPKFEEPGDIESEDVHCELNTEFLQMAMDSPMLQALVAANIAGKLSDEELFDQMQKGAIIGSEKTFEDHQKEIERIKLPSSTEPLTGKPIDGTGEPPTKPGAPGGKGKPPTKKTKPAAK